MSDPQLSGLQHPLLPGVDLVLRHRSLNHHLRPLQVTKYLLLLTLRQNRLDILDFFDLRYILVKYSHRGLADDVLWFNGGLSLFKQLFWTLYLTLLLLPQAAVVAMHYKGETLLKRYEDSFIITFHGSFQLFYHE